MGMAVLSVIIAVFGIWGVVSEISSARRLAMSTCVRVRRPGAVTRLSGPFVDTHLELIFPAGLSSLMSISCADDQLVLSMSRALRR